MYTLFQTGISSRCSCCVVSVFNRISLSLRLSDKVQEAMLLFCELLGVFEWRRGRKLLTIFSIIICLS